MFPVARFMKSVVHFTHKSSVFFFFLGGGGGGGRGREGKGRLCFTE